MRHVPLVYKFENASKNQSLILFVDDVHICASKQIHWKKRQNKRSMDTQEFFQK